MTSPDTPTWPPALPAMLEIDTPRLRLRRWTDADRAPFAALNADPAVMRFFPALIPREASDRSIDAWLADFDARGWSNWAVETRESHAEGRFIGFVGLSVPRRTLPCSPCVEIGWRLARAAHGQGYATEAARAALRAGFVDIGLDEIVSMTAVLNTPSEAVMKRLGMVDSGGNFDHPGVPEGSPLRPHVLYRLTRAQWLAGQQATRA